MIHLYHIRINVCKRVCIWLGSGDTGWRRAWSLSKELSLYSGCSHCFSPASPSHCPFPFFLADLCVLVCTTALSPNALAHHSLWFCVTAAAASAIAPQATWLLPHTQIQLILPLYLFDDAATAAAAWGNRWVVLNHRQLHSARMLVFRCAKHSERQFVEKKKQASNNQWKWMIEMSRWRFDMCLPYITDGTTT